MRRLTKADRIAAEALLRKAQEQQTAFWDTLATLEHLLGVDIESTNDLEGCSVDDLRAA